MVRERQKIALHKECWVDFHKDHMDIMGLQRIEMKDVVGFWLQNEGYVSGEYIYNSCVSIT